MASLTKSRKHNGGKCRRRVSKENSLRRALWPSRSRRPITRRWKCENKKQLNWKRKNGLLLHWLRRRRLPGNLHNKRHLFVRYFFKRWPMMMDSRVSLENRVHKQKSILWRDRVTSGSQVPRIRHEPTHDVCGAQNFTLLFLKGVGGGLDRFDTLVRCRDGSFFLFLCAFPTIIFFFYYIV